VLSFGCLSAGVHCARHPLPWLLQDVSGAVSVQSSQELGPASPSEARSSPLDAIRPAEAFLSTQQGPRIWQVRQGRTPGMRTGACVGGALHCQQAGTARALHPTPSTMHARMQEISRFLRNPLKPAVLAMSRPDSKKNITTLVSGWGECLGPCMPLPWAMPRTHT
jgi:hypothetical protein